jgi:hypothetical protein
MLKNPKLIEGHYECRRFDETLPVFTDLLGMEVIQQRSETEVVIFFLERPRPKLVGDSCAQMGGSRVVNFV